MTIAKMILKINKVFERVIQIKYDYDVNNIIYKLVIGFNYDYIDRG